MEFQILISHRKLWAIFLPLLLLSWSCEKEIQLDIPPSKEELVVEASINQLTPLLNYVVVSKTIDYFNPSLDLNAIKGASVYITEGTIAGTDTFFDPSNRVQFYDVLDTLFPGLYINPLFQGKVGSVYQLDISLPDGRTVNGRTHIPKPVTLDSAHFWFQQNGKDTNAYFYLQWFDGPEQNNYRVVIKKGFVPFLTGWGSGDRYYTFDDELINNKPRPFLMLNPFKYGDTVNVFLSQIGRPEFLFWDSFRSAANNGGPFATPVSVRSNVKGAIGSFIGYGMVQKQFLLR